MFGMFRRNMFGASLCVVLLFGTIPSFGTVNPAGSREEKDNLVNNTFKLMLKKKKSAFSQSYEYREVTHLVGDRNGKNVFQFSNKNGMDFCFYIKDIKKPQTCSKTLLQKVLLKIKRCNKKGKRRMSLLKGRSCNRWLLLDYAGQKFIDYCKKNEIIHKEKLNKINYEKISLKPNEFIVKMRKASRILGKGFSWSYAVRRVVYDSQANTYRFVHKDAKKVFRFEWTPKHIGTELTDGTALIKMKRRKNKILLARNRYLLLDQEGKRLYEHAKSRSSATQFVNKGGIVCSFNGKDVTTIEDGGMAGVLTSKKNHSKIPTLRVSNGLILLTGAHWHLFNDNKDEDYPLNKVKGVCRVVKGSYPDLNISKLPMLSDFIEDIKKRCQDSKKTLKFKKTPYEVDGLLAYLSSMAVSRATTRIGVVREVRQYNYRMDEQRRRLAAKPAGIAKPTWAAGVMQDLNKQGKNIQYIIDFGTGKMALTDEYGLQNDDFYATYEDQETTNVTLVKGQYKTDKGKENKNRTISIKTYFEELEEYLQSQGLSWENIAARFTGDFRLDNQAEHFKRKKDTYMAHLKERQIDCGCLDIRDEAKFGSQHMLSIAGPYIKEYNQKNRRNRIRQVIIEESGTGSVQGVKYVLKNARRRLKSPSGVDALENLLDQCNEQA